MLSLLPSASSTPTNPPLLAMPRTQWQLKNMRASLCTSTLLFPLPVSGRVSPCMSTLSFSPVSGRSSPLHVHTVTLPLYQAEPPLHVHTAALPLCQAE